jgi:hypothetical protein
MGANGEWRVANGASLSLTIRHSPFAIRPEAGLSDNTSFAMRLARGVCGRRRPGETVIRPPSSVLRYLTS